MDLDTAARVRDPRAVTEVRFARSGEVNVAYRVVGDGPIDLVYAQNDPMALGAYFESSREDCRRAEKQRFVCRKEGGGCCALPSDRGHGP